MNEPLKKPAVQNILTDIPAQLPKELFTSLLKNEQLQIERIVSRGHRNAQDEWYDQTNDEWIILIQGKATLEFSGQAELTTLKAGDYLLIPAHCRHRVEWTDPKKETIWLAVHFKS